MKRAIYIRCTQQFLYFESHTKSLKQVCTHYGLFQYTFYQFCILISTYLINEEEISRNERYRVHVQTGITFARRKGITIARKIYLRVFFLFTFTRIACYLEYIQFIKTIKYYENTTGAWGMDFVSSSPLFSTIPPFFKIFI